MRLLVTGGSGLVGTAFLSHPEAKNHEILAPRSSELNLLSFESVLTYLEEWKPQGVVHCAGLVGGIQRNMNAQDSFLVQNVEMGINLVKAAHQVGIMRLLNLGSSCMYPRDRDAALKVEDLLTGQLEPTNEGYALAKIVVQKLCNYVGYKTLLPCNIYGPGDDFHPKRSHLLPAVIHKLHQAKDTQAPITVWGDGEARREFMYSGDLADAMWFCFKRFESLPTALNVGQGYDYRVIDYYRMAAKVIGYTGEFQFDVTKPIGMKRKLVDSTLLNNLGWFPRHSVAEGLKLTYDHYIKKYSHD